MARPEQRDFRYERLTQTLRLYRAGLLLCLLLVLVLTAALVAGGRHRIARAIRLNDVIVCLVTDRAAAKRVQDRLLEPMRRQYGGTAVLREKWEDLDWPVGDNEVLTADQAVGKLAPLVTVLVSATAIRVDGQQALILPSRDLAEKTLEALKAKFISPNTTLIEQHFANRVELADVQVPASLLDTDISQAVGRLLRGSTYTRSYTIRTGDTPDQVARSLGLPLSELARQVPAVARYPLPGAKVQVKVTVPAVKVISIKETVSEKPYALPAETVITGTLRPGEKRVVSPGESGIKRVRCKETWENDKRVRSVNLQVEIVKKAVPARVMVGQPAPPSLAPAR